MRVPSVMIFWKSEAGGAMVSAWLLPVQDTGVVRGGGGEERY